MSANIKTWQERVAQSIHDDFVRRGYGSAHAAMFAEIADLRAENAHLTEQIEALRAALAQRTLTCCSAQAAIVASMLEGYAKSYDIMARDRAGSGKVECRSVAVDLRQNMIPQARKILAAQPVAEAAAQAEDESREALLAAISDQDRQAAVRAEKKRFPSQFAAPTAQPTLPDDEQGAASAKEGK